MLLGVLATLLALGLLPLGLHQRGPHVLDHALAWMLALNGLRAGLLTQGGPGGPTGPLGAPSRTPCTLSR
jgi:hypothetical protein